MTKVASDSPKKERTSRVPPPEPVDVFEWTAENEVSLFTAMRNRRPVGIERNFHMHFISNKFNELVSKEVPPSTLWQRLGEIYDLDALNENNSPPSVITNELDFSLSSDFDDLIEKKLTPDEALPDSRDAIKSAPEKVDKEEAALSTTSTPNTKKTKTRDSSETPGTATKGTGKKAKQNKDKGDKEKTSAFDKGDSTSSDVPDKSDTKAEANTSKEDKDTADKPTPSTKAKKRLPRTSESSSITTPTTDGRKKSAKKADKDIDKTPQEETPAPKKRRYNKKNVEQD